MPRDYVTLRELCEEMGKDRSGARKQALKLGIHMFMVRSVEAGNQLVLAMSSDDAEYFRKVYSEGFRMDRKNG